MSSYSNADIFIQPMDSTRPQESPERQPRSWIQAESKDLPNLKTVHNNDDCSTVAPPADSRSAWFSLSKFKWMMFKKKKEEPPSYLQSVKPGSAAVRMQGDQGYFGGTLQASEASAVRFEKRNSPLRNLGLDDRNGSHDGPQEGNFHVSHPLTPWSCQATANRRAKNANRAKAIISPRSQAFQLSGSQGMGNGAAAEYAESEWSLSEHNARLETSRCDATLLNFPSKQEQQDREMAEQLIRDEELAASLQDVENQARSRDEASLMLAIKLADGLVQDQDAFIRQQIESVEMARVSQREIDLQELQLEADRELALRLQNESSMMMSDNGLADEIRLGSNKPRGWRNKRGAQRQQSSSKDTLAQGFVGLENGPLHEGRWADSAQRSSSTEQGRSIDHRNERQSQRWNQPSEDLAYAQQLQQEFNQQELWHTEAQRVQDTIAIEDRQIQDKIKAEQAEIRQHEDEEDCLICTEAYNRADMVRPCQHWYCRPCLSGKISSSTWLSATSGLGKVSLTKEQRASAMLLTRRNLISVVNKTYPSISSGRSLEHVLSKGIKISSWKM